MKCNINHVKIKVYGDKFSTMGLISNATRNNKKVASFV